MIKKFFSILPTILLCVAIYLYLDSINTRFENIERVISKDPAETLMLRLYIQKNTIYLI